MDPRSRYVPAMAESSWRSKDRLTNAAEIQNYCALPQILFPTLLLSGLDLFMQNRANLIG